MLHPTAETTFIGLIDQAHQSYAIKDSKNPIALTMIYNPNAAPEYGSFKWALFGHLSYLGFSGSTSVCIKQCWYLCKASVRVSPSCTPVESGWTPAEGT
jgi:hypothetical protein